MFRCLLRWDDINRLKVTDFEHQPEKNAYRFMLRGGKTVMHDATPYRLVCFKNFFVVLLNLCVLYFSYLLGGGSETNCVVRMTRFYFEKLGPAYLGSVVPLCSPASVDVPGERVQNYPGALQDLQYVLSLIGENHKGNL